MIIHIFLFQKIVQIGAFAPSNHQHGIRTSLSQLSTIGTALHSKIQNEKDWGIGDDWNDLSSHNTANSDFDSSSIFNVDVASQAANELEEWMKKEQQEGGLGGDGHIGVDLDGSTSSTTMNQQKFIEDDIINNAIDLIQSESLDPNGPALYDTTFHSRNTFDDYTQTLSFADELGKEISLLVRCNESPHDLLVDGGRALPALNDEEKYNISQLLEIGVESKKYEPTEFFLDAVSTMFKTHAKLMEDVEVLDHKGVASWLSQSLDEKVSRHDKRIAIIMSKYATYGSGILTKKQFLRVYLDASMVGLDVSNKKREKHNSNLMRMMKLKQATLKDVWRDFENHGIVPPIVSIREELQSKIDEKYGKLSGGKGVAGTMDECEILEWKSEQELDDAVDRPRDEQTSGNTRKSSHELVELSSDKRTPRKLRDGEFGK